MEFSFKHISPKKLSAIFTWDDNFCRHIRYIAPIFEAYHIRCTFYINPGQNTFSEILAQGYTALSEKGFEIGSHGYSHCHYSKLNQDDYVYQLTTSRNRIRETIGIVPSTFAFPHHDYTEKMLAEAHKVYFETRNTLPNAVRFSLKSLTMLKDINHCVGQAITQKQSIVFSGHSVTLSSDRNKVEGYEPIPIALLPAVLKLVLTQKEHIEICTFEQAALKEYILRNLQSLWEGV